MEEDFKSQRACACSHMQGYALAVAQISVAQICATSLCSIACPCMCSVTCSKLFQVGIGEAGTSTHAGLSSITWCPGAARGQIW